VQQCFTALRYGDLSQLQDFFDIVA